MMIVGTVVMRESRGAAWTEPHLLVTGIRGAARGPEIPLQ